MSGSGGVVYDQKPPSMPCKGIAFRTVLNSPVASVVAEIAHRLETGPVILDIRREARGRLQLALAMLAKERAGAITSDALAKLLECMEGGHEYIAEVLNVRGARVEVQVKHK